MINVSLISAVLWLSYGAEASPTPAQAAAPDTARDIFDSPAKPTATGQLDKIVAGRLSSSGIEPALCSDAVFVRRAYLDVIGTLPTAQEAREFIDSSDPNKRKLLIDRLLERDEFADYWAMKWGDILRIKAEFPVNLWPNAAQAYHRWVRASIAQNKPYDKFVREMLTSSGSNFRMGPVNFYRALQNRTPEGTAAAVALTFMGSRVDSWPRDRMQGMALFFSQIGYKPTGEWKEEHVVWDPLHAYAVPGNTAPGRDAIVAPPKPAEGKPNAKPDAKPAAPAPKPVEVVADQGPLTALFPDGTKVQLPPDRDPREVFADWLISPKNPWFGRSVVNRVWAWLLGRGIVHEPDDLRDNNPPSNPELLAYLEDELVANRYDLKHIYRLILNSNTYQFSSMPRSNSAQAEANFATYPLRRLDAEVLIDAINKITGASDLYTSPIPEPFTYIPRDMPAVAIADGSISSPFLTLFGRSARATGMENERSSKPVPAQWLHMLNSTHIRAKFEQGPKFKAIFEPGRKAEDIVENLYLTILSRRPTADEVKIALEYGAPISVSKPEPPTGKRGKAGRSGKTGALSRSAPMKRREEWLDISWALINSMEFLYRH